MKLISRIAPFAIPASSYLGWPQEPLLPDLSNAWARNHEPSREWIGEISVRNDHACPSPGTLQASFPKKMSLSLLGAPQQRGPPCAHGANPRFTASAAGASVICVRESPQRYESRSARRSDPRDPLHPPDPRSSTSRGPPERPLEIKWPARAAPRDQGASGRSDPRPIKKSNPRRQHRFQVL